MCIIFYDFIGGVINLVDGQILYPLCGFDEHPISAIILLYN